MNEPRILQGLSAVADRYDAFILDQWGVLHNGTAVYPSVMDALAAMRAAGKKICLLTNSGRRASFNRARLAEMGFTGILIEHFAGAFPFWLAPEQVRVVTVSNE